MFCPYCKTQWADFPKEDFNFNPKFGITAKSEGARQRRLKKFNSNEELLCPCCRDDVSSRNITEG